MVDFINPAAVWLRCFIAAGQTGAVQNDRPRLSVSTEETAENVAAVEKNENLEKNPSNSNQNPGEGQNWTVFAMDTVMQFDAYGGSTDLQEK